MFKFTTPLVAVAFALPAFAETLTLTPADPQPAAASLAQGLAVSYAYPKNPRTLNDAADALKNSTPGAPLAGLSYLDGNDGDPTLTDPKAKKVAAQISGFIKFDAAGTYDLEVISNDGISTQIGGQQVAHYDGVHACESAGVTTVEVPSPGYYALEATYFQRKGSSCLLMDWSENGEMVPVPDAAFAFTK